MARPKNSQADTRWRSVAGVFALTLGALIALGMWSGGAAGEVGRLIHLAVRWAFGLPGMVVPLLLIGLGILQFRKDVDAIGPRLVFSTLLTFVSVTGLWHIMAGMPSAETGLDALRGAGGVVGATAAFSLAKAFSTPGAVLILLILTVVGALVFTNTSVGTVMHKLNIARAAGQDAFNQWQDKRAEAKALKAERDALFEEERQAQAATEDFAAEDDEEAADIYEDYRDQQPADDLSPPSFITDFEADGYADEYGDPEYAHGDDVDDDPMAQTAVDMPRIEAGKPPVERTLLYPRRGVSPSPNPNAPAHAGAVSGVPITRSTIARAPRTPDESIYELSDEELLAQINGDHAVRDLPTAADLVDDSELDDAERAELNGDDDQPATKLVPRDSDDYELPPLAMLETGHAAPDNHESLERMRVALEQMLEQFGVDAQIVAIRRGPTVTRFEIELGIGVKVAAITKLDRDIAYALATPDVRIVAPIPGKVAIGIEVPNEERDFITLGDILMSDVAEQVSHPLAVALGLDIGGRPVMINLAKMPHLLIAGATGSGKSVVMNGIVTSLIMRNTPDQVRMILIDPKQVEMAIYEDVPHLLTRVVTDPKRAKDALDWLVDEMERRYGLLRDHKVRHLDTYNEKVSDEEFLPYIVCIIDELADLMMVAKNDVESAIVRIAQKARAVGIHLVIATQRPSVNVVTGLIKANVPSRIALSMATGHDSKTILDQYGAEKLIGQGDMLYMPANVSKPHRLQGSYVDETEIEEIVAFCKTQSPVVYEENVIKEGADAIMADIKGEDATDEDLTRAAMDLVVRSGLGSTSMLQRKLQIGFARAGRIMDELERMGVVGPSEGPKARVVLMTVDELEDLPY